MKAPERLRVRTDLDGFSCELPGLTRGSNSSWILVFVAVWWAVSAALVVGATTLQPELLDMELNLGVGLLGAAATIGWGPGWYAFDAWWASRNPRPFEADALGITFEGRRWLFSDLDRLSVAGGYLSFRTDSTAESIRLKLRPHEEEWFEAQLMPLFERVDARDGAVPDDLETLTRQH